METNGASTANGLQVAATTTLDVRSGGNAAEMFWANFELAAGFGTAPTQHNIIDLYLVPALDGTNYADIDATGHNLPSNCYVGSFEIILSQTTSQRMVVLGVPLMPLLYKAYLVNNSGQTISAAWTLKVVAAEEQYS